MIQAPLPGEVPDSVNVPLPAGFERWRDLHFEGALEKVVVFLAIALFLYLLTRLARQAVRREIDDVNRRHVLQKWIGYLYVVLLFLVGLALFADSLVGLGTVLAVIVAGVAVALQDVLKSFVGWIYISSRAGVEVGSRVEVEGVLGDVIDVGVLKTTVLEVGNLVYGRQSTGRLATIPNYRLLSETVLISAADSPFVWNEMKLVVTYESDWQRAEEILREISTALHEEIAAELEVGFRRLERRFAFKYGTLTPIVYVTMEDHGVALTLRYMVHARRRRGSVDRVSRQVLQAFAQEPSVELAYPTHRVFRLGESAEGRGGAADMHRTDRAGDRRMEQGAEEGLPPPDLLEGGED